MKRPVVAAALLGAFAYLTATSLAADVEGRFLVEGRNAGGMGIYKGQAAIRRNGDTYQVNWTFGTERHVGTGLLNGDSFAVTYVRSGGGVPGVVLYHIRTDGRLVGHFTDLGGTRIGSEVLLPVDRP